MDHVFYSVDTGDIKANKNVLNKKSNQAALVVAAVPEVWR